MTSQVTAAEKRRHEQNIAVLRLAKERSAQVFIC
jgi:hypothetical protein